MHTVAYAYSGIMSFLEDRLPVEELLRIWDFLLAFGLHMNILINAANYMVKRDDIFKLYE